MRVAHVAWITTTFVFATLFAVSICVLCTYDTGRIIAALQNVAP